MDNERVYLFRHIGTDHVKIGMTKNADVLERFKAFSTYAPLGAEIVGVIATNDALFLEKKLHHEFKEKRLNGEFFKLTDGECLQIVKKYNDQKRNQCISTFFEIISDQTLDIDKILVDLKKHRRRIDIPHNEFYNLIKNFLENNKSDVWLTATEIKEQIELSYNVKIDSMKLFGQELRKVIGQPKAKRINNNNLSRYFVKKSLL